MLVMNGAGLEDFMGDALAASDAAVIDCSEALSSCPPWATRATTMTPSTTPTSGCVKSQHWL